MKTGIEIYKSLGGDEIAVVNGPITDAHMHPRLFDRRIPRLPEIPNGKAGIGPFTITALRIGISRGLFMPNETLRLYAPEEPEQTKEIPYPITNVDRLMAAVAEIQSGSHIYAGMIVGVDREAIGLKEGGDGGFSTKYIEDFFSHPLAKKYAAALKLYGAETTGGYNIPLETIVPIAEVWHKHNAGKPLYLHLEDEGISRILVDIPPYIRTVIAHISSEEELTAVAVAQDDGKEVYCEATPHHLFLTEVTSSALGGKGCVKPPLRSENDRRFLWANMDRIAMFASDCAPHRLIDKIGIDGQGGSDPRPGFANHDIFIRTLLHSMAVDGSLTSQQLYERLVTNPSRIFNLPLFECSTYFNLTPISAEEATDRTPYGVSPFINNPETPPLVGKLLKIEHAAGALALSTNEPIRPLGTPSYDKVISF